MGLATENDDGPALLSRVSKSTRRFPWSHQHYLQTPPQLLLDLDSVEVGQLTGHQGVGILVRVESCPSFQCLDIVGDKGNSRLTNQFIALIEN